MAELSPVAEPSTVDIDRLVVAYGRHVAVAAVSLAVQAGETVAITGSNGSGKSSLVRSVIGLSPTRSGSVKIDGTEPISRANWSEIRRRVAYIPQRPPIGRFPISVGELIGIDHRSTSGGDAMRRAAQLGVSDLLNEPVDHLSGGQLQRCFVARAIARIDEGAGLLLADEPTSALDFEGQDEVAELLVSTGATLIVVSHERSLVSRCSRVLEMAGGHIRESSTS